ncbi:CHAP domain-containing protein [uncultured Gemella sp.]|uniref:CHAP domain-containing protein n=1 Tax=uncultured Gemella sp. TaxID=254352 RepID=UPI0028D0B9FA|nr:CHAP domain-containing protein [uncultured Gemella sp.]
MKKNRLKFGLGVLTVLATPIAVNTVAGTEVHAAQGWVQGGSSWFFFNNQGQLVRNAWAGNYWLGADGKMVTDAWVDNGRYYVGSNGAWVKGAQKPAEVKKQGWVQNGSAWYYYYQGNIVRNAWIGSYWLGSDGKMATNTWVDGGRYYVGANGVWDKNAKKQEAPKPVEKKNGWVKEGNTWYYYNQGIMVRNAWQGNYWLGSDGKMATNTWVDNDRYYVGADGSWDKNAKKQEEKKQGWKKEGNSWYYYHQGQMVKNAWVGSYWLGTDGKMVTNSWVDNDRYYVGANGVWEKDKKKEEKKRGWKKENNVWYYYNEDGTLARNKWTGNYWLGSDGKMVTNAWVDNNRYYVGSNGAWEKDKKKEDPIPTGKHTGWVKSGSTWYYFNAQGQMVKNAWAGNYWLGSDGKMATNSWVDNNRYFVGSDGAWVQNPTNNTNLNRVLDIARSYLGVETGSREHKKIVDAYNSVDPKPVGYTANYQDDWCDIFVTTVYQQAGLSDLIGRECGVQRHIGIMEKKGIWKGRTQPKVGDIVTFDWDGGGWADHIGIVESVNNGVITTIEGNSSLYAGSTAKTKVNRKTYNWNSSYIKGYARPAY